MQFNQAQVRDTIGISAETLRHWKRVLPPFSERKKYTLGDLLAAGVLCRLTNNCGVRAGRLPEVSKAVVEICNTNAWTSLQRKTIIVNVQKKTCALIEDVGTRSFKDAVIVCPLRGLMAQIQQELLRKQPTIAQHHLRFLPNALSRAHTQRRRA